MTIKYNLMDHLIERKKNHFSLLGINKGIAYNVIGCCFFLQNLHTILILNWLPILGIEEGYVLIFD